LIDATGKPKNKANVAKTDFEKKAVTEMNAGKGYYEEIAQVDGKDVLRVATVVPVVLQQCAVCHGKKKGDVLGAIVYEIAIK
jgi:mono/diheme cytochrome c family protein